MRKPLMYRDVEDESTEGENSFEFVDSLGPRKRHLLHRVTHSRVFHVAALFLVLQGYLGWTETRDTIPSLGVPDRIWHSWAHFSPYFPLEEYREPSGCTITQVNIIQRHGAASPSEIEEADILASLANIKNATAFNSDNLRFVEKYKYDLGHKYSHLIPFGVAQSQDAGQEAFHRYFHLVSRDNLPFVRASSRSRVRASAKNWITGFIHASGGAIIPASPLVLSSTGNNTLDGEMCVNAGGSRAQTSAWRNIFAPAVAARLNSAAPGATLANDDIINLMTLCTFESVMKDGTSPWCKVFDQHDFDDFGYDGDLKMYYKKGYGQPLGPVQGVGYVNELLARLTNSPVNDSTQTNRTLDTSPATFPLNRTLYVDFTHKNVMIAIYAAMGIMRPVTVPDPTYRDPHRTWIASHLAPYSARLVTERLHCEGRGASVRMLIDDAVVPLEICGAGKDGICSLDAFVESQGYAQNNGEGDWEKCFA